MEVSLDGHIRKILTVVASEYWKEETIQKFQKKKVETFFKVKGCHEAQW